MRDLIVLIAIFSGVFIASFYTEKYLVDSGNSIVEKLTVIKDEVEEDSMESMDELVKIKEEWDTIEDIWNMFLNHQITDNIELSFTRLLISYGEDEKAECLVNIAEIVGLIEDAPRTEKIALANLF